MEKSGDNMKRKVNRFWKERVLESLERGDSSLFLDPLEFKIVTKSLPSNSYLVWKPFKESDYKIVYRGTEPRVCCFKILCEAKLTHSMIMGSLYSLNIESGYIGDIVVSEDCYFFVLSSLKEYIEHHLTMIGSHSIKLVEVDSSCLLTYQRSYEELEILVPSLRLDVVLAKLAHTSRRIIKEKFINEEVTLNYEITKNGTIELRENDIFSLRRCGKFKFVRLVGTTKKGNKVILLHQYK